MKTGETKESLTDNLNLHLETNGQEMLSVTATTLKEGFIELIESRTARIGVIGLGYVGLPLLWTFHEKGFPVVGFDIDPGKIEALESGRPYIKHLGAQP